MNKKINSTLLSVTIYLGAILLISIASTFQCYAQPIFAQREYCKSGQEALIDQRQKEIETEVTSLKKLPVAGYYHAVVEDINWFLLWAPKSGFIAYMLADYPCPSQVYFGKATYERGKLCLIPQKEFDSENKHIFTEEYFVVSYRKQKYLVPKGKMRKFYRSWRRKYPSFSYAFLGQQKFDHEIWNYFR